MKKIKIIFIVQALLVTCMNSAPPKEHRYKNTLITHSATTEKIPIVYSEHYNFFQGGLLNRVLASLHPFDAQKYHTIATIIERKFGLLPSQLYDPENKVSDDQLALVHTQEYLKSLQSSATISAIVDMGIAFAWVPNAWFQHNVLDPMRYAVSGTILAAQLALRYGWAINLAGGYHHAKANSGEGGCVFGDIPLALHVLWQHNPNLKVMIVDLDAHQSNGVESMLRDKQDNVFIFDIFNKNVEHTDDALAALPNVRAIALDGGRLSSTVWGIEMPDLLVERCVDRRIGQLHYLKILKEAFPQALAQCSTTFGHKPDLIIYNAGTDIHAEDKWGCLDISTKGIYDRDEYIFAQAINNNIPILMLPAGGYFKESGTVIGNSIVQIIKKFKLLEKIQ